MLKWAVNQPRPSYLDKAPEAPLSPTLATPTPSLMQRAKAKRHCQLGLDKENVELVELTSTSTPLPAPQQHISTRLSTPLLRDLSNIMMSPMPPQQTTTTPHQVPRCRSHTKPQAPAQAVYASTLPTFEAEYSPSYSCRTNESSIIPGPLLALRGIAIPDSYFEKPRYLEQKPLPSIAPSAEAVDAPLVEPTLSSTQMGDVTLERMIDAILESTRKPPAGVRAAGARPRCRQRLRQRHQQRLLSTSATATATSTTHSPTYRPAFDPASDLCEYWKSSAAAPSNGDYEEREVCSPQGVKQGRRSMQLQLQLQLRRQRVVRRKRKITTKISSSVRHSAQKLLAAASRSAQKKLPHATSATVTVRSGRHISPDSGHNTTSDCEFEEEQELDSFGVVTKRRLSFSFHEDPFVEK
ncbi:hypothetical protein KR093_010402 [Drosophila rubida]|uniref:Uncharacterized protein n=1 Tax=Drosophila rubida TaxID=30044 RepID=A0AAD4KBR0_9MUSC|nr:hypothetical protein KR093_010402 [Drosophila rubida]